MPVRGLVPSEPPSPARAALIATACLGVAVLVRWAANPLLQGNSPYLPFLVASLLATISGGLWAGVATGVLGGVVANLLFVGEPWRLDFALPNVTALLIYWVLVAFVVAIGDAMTSAIRRERALNDQLRILTAELDHRARNMLAVIQSVIRQTEGSAESVRDFRDQLEDRLHAVSAAQSLLSQARGGPLRIDELVRDVLAPFALEDRLVAPVEGPPVEISPDLAVALALLLHELATNAAKHGALSTDEGKVAFSWETQGPEVAMRWREVGGPGVTRSDRRGFGSRLFKAALPPNRGSVQVHFKPEGVSADIRMPVSP